MKRQVKMTGLLGVTGPGMTRLTFERSEEATWEAKKLGKGE